MITIDLLKNHPETISALANIWHEVLGKIWVPDIPVERVIEKFADHLNDDILPLTFVAFDGDIPVGMCSLRENDGANPNEGYVATDITPRLGALVVDPKYQKHGIGKMLVDAVKHKAVALGFNTLYLLTFETTITYYTKLGWTKIGISDFREHKVTIMKIGL